MIDVNNEYACFNSFDSLQSIQIAIWSFTVYFAHDAKIKSSKDNSSSKRLTYGIVYL